MATTAQRARRSLTDQSDDVADLGAFDLCLERRAPQLPVRVWKATAVTAAGHRPVWVSASDGVQKIHSVLGAPPMCPCCPQFACAEDVADFHLGLSVAALGVFDTPPSAAAITGRHDLDDAMLTWVADNFTGAAAVLAGWRYLGQWYGHDLWYVEIVTHCRRRVAAWTFLQPEPAFVRAARPHAMSSVPVGHTLSPTPDGAALLHLGRSLSRPGVAPTGA
jgi:hypothetical protein